MRLETLFVVLLFVSGLITLAIGGVMLLDSEGFAESNGIAWDDEGGVADDEGGVADDEGGVADDEGGVATLVTALGATVASLGALQIIAGLWLRRGDVGGANLGVLMGAVLLFLGLASYLGAGAVPILLLDGIRGVILLAVGLPVRRRM